MVAMPNMNWMGNEPSGSAYDVYQYYLGGGNPNATPGGGGGGGTTGIMQAFPPTGDGGGGIGGNAFGYGSAIKPGDPSVLTEGPYAGQSGYYGSGNYTPGGLPGNVTQKGPGRHFQYDDSKNVYRDYSLTPKKELPAFASAALGVLPFGNFLRGKIDAKMNPTGPLTSADINKSSYKVGGLDPSMKGLYDSLAGQGMLFEGSTGLKTLTGKNFTGKGYLEGQLELAKGFGFDKMSDEEIQEAIETEKARRSKSKTTSGFKYKQMLEASTIYNKNKAAADKKKKDDAAKYTAPQHHKDVSQGPGGGGGEGHQAKNIRSEKKEGIDTKGSGMHGGKHYAQGGMIKDLTKDPEYRGWKKMYETNPEVGSMHDKHPTFIKFYKQHERDQKKFGGLAGLLYG